MGLIEAIVLGIVQGLTEFLPISSSGHVMLVPALFGWGDPGAGFTAVIQIGTLMAVFLYFWKDLVNIFKGWTAGLGDKSKRDTLDWKLAWGIVYGTIPIVVLGLLFEDQIDTTLRSPWIAVCTLAFFGILMGIAEIVAKRTREVNDFRVKDGIVMGLWQTLAIIPGSSRSGSTITGGMFMGFDRDAAARVSFLLSVPSVLGSGLYKLLSEREELIAQGWMATLVATIVSFISGYAAIAFLMNFLKSRSTWVFVIYRVVLAGVIAFLLQTGFLQA